MKQMQICDTVYYVGNFDKPELNAAGKRVYGIALILEKLGYRVVLIGKSKDKEYNTPPKRYSRSIYFYSIPNYGMVQINAYMRYLSKIIKKEGEAHLIIRYGCPCLALFDGTLLQYCNKNNIPLIADVVDWLPSNGPRLMFNVIKSIDTYLEKAIYNRMSNGVIAISTYLANYYETHNCENVIVIPPIVKEYWKEISLPSSDNINIVYAGTPFRIGQRVRSPHDVKDRIDLTILALMDLKADLTLNIYGLTQNEYFVAYPSHKTMVESDRRIVFHGKKQMETIQRAVHDADLTILLRDVTRATSAGFPTKAVESISCGTPIITTNTSDLAKYVVDKSNGFIVSIDDFEELKMQLLEAIGYYRNHRKEMKENCLSNRSFLPNGYVSQFEDYLDRVITSKRTRG